MQYQAVNMLALQNLQDHLKYLVLSTSLERKTRPAQSRLISLIETPIMLDYNSSNSSPTLSSTSDVEVNFPTTPIELEQERSNGITNLKQKSQRLWKLLSKKYSNKKFNAQNPATKSSEERKLNRDTEKIYVPRLKKQAQY